MTIDPPGQALRRQADRALRLARAVSDEQAAQALRLHANSLFEQAETLEAEHSRCLHPMPSSSDQHSNNSRFSLALTTRRNRPALGAKMAMRRRQTTEHKARLKTLLSRNRVWPASRSLRS